MAFFYLTHKYQMAQKKKPLERNYCHSDEIKNRSEIHFKLKELMPHIVFQCLCKNYRRLDIKKDSEKIIFMLD